MQTTDIVLVVTDRETGAIDLVHTLTPRMARDLAPFTEEDDDEGHFFIPDNWERCIVKQGIDLTGVPVYRHGVRVA